MNRPRTPVNKNAAGSSTSSSSRQKNKTPNFKSTEKSQPKKRLEGEKSYLQKAPEMKAVLSLKSDEEVDEELEFDLALSDHYQALLKRVIVKKAIEKRQQVQRDQIAMAEDEKHKTFKALDELSQKLKTLDLKSSIDLLETTTTSASSGNIPKKNLEKLLDLLKKLSTEIKLKNIIVSNPEELTECIEKFGQQVEKFANSNRDFERMGELGEVANQLIQNIEAVQKNISDINGNSTRYTLDTVRQLSNMFASKE